MEALSFALPRTPFARCLLVLLSLCAPAYAASAHPALIPLPAQIAWHEGAVRIGADTRIEARGEAAAVGAVLSRQLGLGQGARGASRIRLALVPASKIA